MGSAASIKEELSKPLDAADLTTDAAKSEVIRLRALLQQEKTYNAVIVDCGSGHSGILCYQKKGESNIAQTAKLSVRSQGNKNFTLTNVLIEGTYIPFINQLKSTLEENNISLTQDLLYIGATGGVREAVENGTVTNANVEAFREAITTTFSTIKTVKFAVLDAVEEEARWELDAVQLIWGGSDSIEMFPLGLGGNSIGLFSGGGKSMQLAVADQPPRSFPFSTFVSEFEGEGNEEIWLDAKAWERYTATMEQNIQAEMLNHATKFKGNFVFTAMNHRAAMYSNFAERPILVGEAIEMLRAALLEFREGKGDIFEKMMSNRGSASSTYPLRRIASLHTFRLLSCLEQMFDVDSQLYFARKGKSGLECEWTLGCFSLFASGVGNS